MDSAIGFGALPLEYSGTGPGARTKDGCSVEVYRRAAYAGEIEHLRPWLPAGTSVLELGCGTGLLTHRLLEFGCEVTGVDNSMAMLAHVKPEVRRICADIEALKLDERYDVVLLPSGLVNHADRAVRHAFIAAAARHVSPGGQLILKRQDPAWLSTAPVGLAGKAGGMTIEVLAAEREADPEEGLRVRMTLRYAQGDEAWTHAFCVIALEEPAIVALLGAHGFGAPEALEPKRLWLSARLAAA